MSVDENEAEKMKSSIFLPCIEITVALVNTCESQDDDSDLFESGQQWNPFICFILFGQIGTIADIQTKQTLLSVLALSHI